MDDQLLAGRRILVIEDEMLVLMALEDMMSDFGCTSITVAGNLEEALALIAAQPFDLATLDVNLHGERSYPVADALNDAGVPFAFSTGYGGHGIDERYGVHPVLDKPFDGPQLERVLTALLASGKTPN
jgi:CheY-like chemotaxis protein